MRMLKRSGFSFLRLAPSEGLLGSWRVGGSGGTRNWIGFWSRNDSWPAR
jgi:hypothetical protein